LWYEELGSILEPRIANLARQLGVTSLAVWVLRFDGRHFLEETPPLSSGASGENGAGNGRRTAPAGAGENAFDPVEVVDSDDPEEMDLVFEALYPEVLRPPSGWKRRLPHDSALCELIRRDLFEPVRMSLPTGALPPGHESTDTDSWVCPLGIGPQQFGIIAFPDNGQPDMQYFFAKVWKTQAWDWQRLQMEMSLARRKKTLEAVQTIGNTITSQFEIHDILQSVTEQASVLMGAKTSSLLLVDEGTQELVIENVYGASPDYLQKPNLSVETSLLGRVIRTGRPIMVRNVLECEAYAHKEFARAEGLVSLLSVPLKWRDKSIGILNVYSGHHYKYTQDSVYLLSLLASQSAIAIHNARAILQAKNLEDQVHELDKRSMVGELAAGVAHEIRNPLAAVKMLVDSWECEDADQRQDLEVISTQLRGINRCVTQLLEVASPRPPQMAPVDLTSQVATVLQILRVRLRDQGVTMELDIPEDLPSIEADAPRLRQLLMNIILNALNIMTKGGSLWISAKAGSPSDFDKYHGNDASLPEVSEMGSEGRVILSLADSGGGASISELSKMFEPFQSNSPGGFGLGLSVVKRIVQEHKSALKVENVPGVGLAFHISFPMVGTLQVEDNSGG